MKQILVSGSSAYDNLLHYDGLFSEMEKSELLNMSIVSSSFEKNHGGTGANIAYNLALLGERVILLSSIGEDHEFSGVIKEKVNLSYVHKQSMVHSANSIIISDNQDNRMTIFHSGAMDYASSSKLEYVQEMYSIGIVSANHIPTMIEYARGLSDKKISFFIDPSQQTSQLSRNDLDILLESGTHLIANHHEFSQILAKTTKTESEILEMFEIVIVTHGAEGLHLFQNGTMLHVPAIKVEDFNDTTGAGDALRAGILYGIIEGHDIKTSCQLGTILASYCILSPGSQQHHFSLGNVMEDMETHYGVKIDLFNKRKY